jgi:hypothetical protein
VTKVTVPEIKAACDIEGLKWETDGAKVAACIRSYGANARKLNVLAVEQELVGQNWVIYIDAIMGDDTHWYMVDTKFVANLDKNVKAKLRKDSQVWLYMAAHKSIEMEGIVPGLTFGGFLYREIVKPAIRAKKTPETWEEFTQRCGTPEYRETHVPYDVETGTTNMRNLSTWLNVARGMQAHDIVGRNYNNCIQRSGYVCESYSKCHGFSFSSLGVEGEE